MTGDRAGRPAGNSWTAEGTAPRDAALRLFCLPYAGGSASVFRTWAAAFAPSIAVCPVQWPGRGTRWREPPVDDLAALVAATASGLDGYVDIPFAVFGHSLGALVGFELTRYWRQRGAALPVALFVSGCNAAHCPSTSPPIATLPDTELFERLRALGGITPEVLDQPELIAFYLPVVRADLAAAETYGYRAEPPLSCPITAFAGTRDPEADRDSVRSWHEHTRGLFTLCELPGDHFFIHSAARDLTAIIAAQLTARLQAG